VNELDAQPLRDPAELGEAVAALRLFGVDAENAARRCILRRAMVLRVQNGPEPGKAK
jgi:hypothetical protein